jgi:RimJ/RimL family protein N-acetyltransferase
MSTSAPVTLETPRLVLRPPDMRDVDGVFAMYSDPHVARYLSHPAWDDRAMAVQWVERMQRQLAEGSALQLMLHRKPDDAVLGTCVLFHFHAESRRAEVGYAQSSAHWGHGYIHEALGALFDHAFDTLQLRRIEADIDPRNAASARVL